MDDIKEKSCLQRKCLLGEPACIICGKYAEYICSITESDICSLECKEINLKNLQVPIRNPPADNIDSYLSTSLLRNVDFTPSKAFLEIIPSVLYNKDILLIAPKQESRDLCLVIPLIQRLEKTQKKLLVIVSTNPEAEYLLNLFRKYSKNVKKFRVRGLYNNKALPSEVYEALNGTKVVVSTVGRFLRANEIRRINLNYIWFYDLGKILRKWGSSKVYQVYKIIEKIDDFSVMWNRRFIEIVYITIDQEDALSQITILRLTSSHLLFKFEASELSVKKNIPILQFFRCKNRIKTIKWLLTDNPSYFSKTVCLFTKKFSIKIKKILKIFEFHLDVVLLEETVVRKEIDILINVEFPGIQDFQQQLNSLPSTSTILTLISDEGQEDLFTLRAFLQAFTAQSFPALDVKFS